MVDREKLAELEKFARNPWGVYRSPRYSAFPVNTTLNDSNFGITSGASPPGNSDTATIEPNVKIVSWVISLNPLKRDQTGTNVRFKVYLNENIVATYSLPDSQAVGDPVVWFVNDIVPYNFETNGVTTIKAELTADNGGATGYVINYSVTAIGVAI